MTWCDSRRTAAPQQSVFCQTWITTGPHSAFLEIKLEAKPTKVDDGLIVNASIVDGDENIVPGTRRMIFVAGTPPALAVANASGGDRFEVLGIPRVNLKRVMDLVTQNGTKQFKTQIPYEMIVVGIY